MRSHGETCTATRNVEDRLHLKRVHSAVEDKYRGCRVRVRCVGEEGIGMEDSSGKVSGGDSSVDLTFVASSRDSFVILMVQLFKFKVDSLSE